MVLTEPSQKSDLDSQLDSSQTTKRKMTEHLLEEDAELEQQYQAMNEARASLRAQLLLIREKPLNKLTKSDLKDSYEQLIEELLFSYESWQARVERRLKLNEIMARETQRLVEEEKKNVEQLKTLNKELMKRITAGPTQLP